MSPMLPTLETNYFPKKVNRDGEGFHSPVLAVQAGSANTFPAVRLPTAHIVCRVLGHA